MPEILISIFSSWPSHLSRLSRILSSILLPPSSLQPPPTLSYIFRMSSN